MKICVLISDLSSGGAERVASLWVQGFVERGHNVSIILNSDLPIAFGIPESVSRYNMAIITGNRVTKYLFYPLRLIKLRKHLKKTKPDVVISVLHPMGIYAKLASFGLGCKIINTEHNSFERPEDMPLPLISRINKFYVNKFFDVVTVLTEVDKRIAQNKLHNVVVMPNPLPYQPYMSPRDKGRNKTILVVGRIDAWKTKGFDIILKVWDRMCVHYPDWNLIIAGKGRESNIDYLKSLSSNCLRNKQLLFRGFSEDMEQLYRSSEIFVLYSRHEGFGMALLEAMSQGCACVTSDFHGRQKEIVGDSGCALIVESVKEDELQKALSKLLNDSELRNNMGNKSVVRSSDYSLDKIMDKWDALLENILIS